MIKNYLKIAWRNLRKQKMFSVINIAGLAIGLAVCWVIMLYVSHEMSYDTFHTKSDRIYRVIHKASWPGGSFNLAPTSGPYGPTLKKEFPEVDQFVRFVPEGGGFITYKEKQLKVDDIFFTDPKVFDVFTYPLAYGDAETALQKPKSIVLTTSLATKLFGDPSRAMGKVLFFGGDVANTVTGVMQDLPDNSQLQFNALRSLPEGWTTGWQNYRLYTYVLLKKQASAKSLEAKFPAFIKKYVNPGAGEKYSMQLQPLTTIHLHSDQAYEPSPTGSMRNVYLFILIAVLVLMVACINYMNLSTAKASVRVCEVGIRKALGSGRGQVAALFWAESLCLSLLAAILGLFIAEVALPWFNYFAQTNLHTFGIGITKSLRYILAFVFAVGCLSGLYPSLLLSGYKTTSALKGKLGNQQGQSRFRQSLVTFQFVITIVLMVTSLVAYRQLNYMLDKDLGFNKDKVLTFHIEDQQTRKQIPTIKAQFLKNPYIQAASSATNPIGNNDIGTNGFFFEKNGRMLTTSTIAQNFKVDEDFLSTMEIGLTQGRNFSKDRTNDINSSVLVNQALVEKMGWEKPIGKQVQFQTNNRKAKASMRVIGVVKDFHIYSLQHKVEPLVLQLAPPRERDNFYVRIDTRHTQAALLSIKKTFGKFESSHPIEISFLDQNFARQYTSERKQSNLFLLFTVLAVGIACLGLLGLTAFMIDRRKKEIGIRKIVGASTTGIVSMLSKDFLKLVLFGFIIAVPVSWYAMHRWLQSYAYKINIGPGIFLLAGGIALFIAIATVSWQSIHAALANPVDSLRSE